jgi:uncharacterized Zn-binding protein involved in type VI secretion
MQPAFRGFDMRRMLTGIASAGLALAFATGAIAQDTKDGTPGVITGGSSNTSIGGLPAVRSGDTIDSGGTVQGTSKDVFINGRPAVVTGDKSGCGGIVVGSGSNVFVNGKPVARSGDLTTDCQGR